MPNVSATNTTSASITVAGHKVYYIDSTDAEIVEVEGQVGAISNTAAIYIRGYKCGYDITLTQSGYENFSGVLACEFKGVIYTNYQQTTTQTCNYSGNVTFTNGSGTVEVAPFSWTYYGDSITQHDCTDNTSVKYNAFKYALSGTPYWYVIDGEHDTWTDDLSAWGYNEVRPVVELPTVTPDNWVLPDTSSGVTIIQGGSTSAAGKAGAEPREKVAFDNSCVYATTFWRHADNTFAGRVEIAPVNNSGYIGLHNTTNQALEVYWVNYAACSDSTATVVTVCDSSNNAYNAFKYTLNGTDYYYVLDGTQTDWTDDLSSIGYHIPLPTVTLDAGWVSIYPNHEDFPPNELREGRIWGSGGWIVSAYDPTKSYATNWWHTDSTGGNMRGYYGVIISDYNGRLGITNVLSYTMTRFVEAHYATCDSPDATAVPVYNSSDVAYTAFKYTRGGVDYYYVLDDVQSDWTDDLGSIGYRGYQEIVLYMPGGSGVAYGSQYGVTSGYTGDPNSRYLYPLYSDPECTIPASYDATKRYEAGYYHYQTGEWTVKPIQTVTDMPSSTVSQSSDKTTFAEILHNDNGVAKLWAINNYVSSYPPYAFSYGSNPVSFRFRLKTILAV